ncbi:tRNA-pseudouridine synthase, putative [Theileria equi strain WA]|uniref:tRNA pseudouridine(55) synthase n=1 Tax=Theileria equi strain WA TaxID=1537102 RepID=L0AWI5_THEEQ|nr:tRNA-pseudouridine synthase, putative [Theileria equi strain WA]AFZ79274.1 tRNA-pseudouridine synthase, putative [Theileria equi strain WA]|eukprot:XP_004828940.1 tRNA-pseudouridine synthase, putative [Theileria equi strain WA]
MILPIRSICYVFILLNVLYNGKVVSYNKITPFNSPINGFLNIYKPRGLRSGEIVTIVKNIILRDLNLNLKVGHGGTLDAFAEGILALGIGDATKGLGYFLKGCKEYYCTAEFGYETDTNDPRGEIVHTAPWDHITPEMLDKVINKMHGQQKQTAPAFSAKKIDGVALYRYARQKMPVPSVTKTIYVHSINRENLHEDLPKFTIRVRCSSGTYVRAIIKDIGIKLNSRATPLSLIRTKKCHLNVEDSISLYGLTGRDILAYLQPLPDVPTHLV